MIYKFQPFSTSKDLGNEYNAHCSMVPDGSWILVLDYDCMVLAPEAYSIMEAAIAKYPNAEIFGAVTNRVGYREQMLGHKMNDDDSIKNHLLAAKDLAATFRDGQCKPITTAAGFFLLFKKEYWAANNFQAKIYDDLTMRLFDWNFCRPAMERKTIYMIQGVYVWHTYRLITGRHSQAHLK